MDYDDEDEGDEWEYYDEQDLEPDEKEKARLASHSDAILGLT